MEELILLKMTKGKEILELIFKDITKEKVVVLINQVAKDAQTQIAKEIFGEIELMVTECSEKGLATEFILMKGLPKIKKKYLEK